MNEALWVAKFLEFLPHGQALGIELGSVDPARGGCVMRLPWRAELVGDPERQILHGGVITGLLDSLGAATTIARGLVQPATLDLRIDYLRPARALSDLIAEAECYRTTRHIAFVRGLCHQGERERPVANLTATFMIGERLSLLGGSAPSPAAGQGVAPSPVPGPLPSGEGTRSLHEMAALKSTLSEALQKARASGDYNLLLAELPYARFLGLRAEQVGAGLRVALPFQPNLVGNPALPALHGGVVGACLEMAALLQVIHMRDAPPFPKTVDFTVDYLRAARAEPLFAEAEVQRLGRRIVNVRMRAYQSDAAQPVALGRGNFLVD